MEILDFAESSVGGFPNLGTPLATSRETPKLLHLGKALGAASRREDRTSLRPTQWLNFSRRILD
ncbi:hypothetical protein H6G36_18730 [Anabaena minutissima FACHB-250]|nr:hypothetical protein [Anabaena minutissima FACHB-250]